MQGSPQRYFQCQSRTASSWCTGWGVMLIYSVCTSRQWSWDASLLCVIVVAGLQSSILGSSVVFYKTVWSLIVLRCLYPQMLESAIFMALIQCPWSLEYILYFLLCCLPGWDNIIRGLGVWEFCAVSSLLLRLHSSLCSHIDYAFILHLSDLIQNWSLECRCFICRFWTYWKIKTVCEGAVTPTVEAIQTLFKQSRWFQKGQRR